ncbi:protein kinase [Actinomadura sp. SCN-SB]|uniref:protein kinase domain-containing protein n=1 Tax=Actinomadura sp. SCN-SB TaxID=3373092 RepID=UPI003753C36A
MQPPSRHGLPFTPLGPGDPQLIGGYRTLARLGSGRLGPVYLATTQSGRRLAIKTTGPELAADKAFRRRLKSQIAAAQRVRGRFLAAVVDGHAEGTSPWLATEYVPGPSLARAVEEAGPLPVPAVRALLGAVAEALQAIHDADLVHGRLGPSNVLLAEDGPRVTDHGSAVDEAGPAQDVLDLGLLALFAATGQTPSGEEPPGLGGCPEELREPIARCLAADPSERPELRALAADLEGDRPGPGWLPPGVAALLPAYQGDPPRPHAAPLPTPRPSFEPPLDPSPAGAAPSGGGAAVTAMDAPAQAAREQAPRPNFALPLETPATVPGVMAGHVPPVMDSYRHDLAIALGIGAGAFGLLVLILLLVFLL